MDFLGYINAEGGPLLLADSLLVPYWKGIEGADYSRACAIFDNNPKADGAEIVIGAGTGVVWEMQGAGTADVFKHSESHLCITRTWPHDPQNSRAAQLVSIQPTRRDQYIGDLLIPSGKLVILWAPEDGNSIGLTSEADVSRPTGNMAIDTAGLVVRVSRSSFACFHDNVEVSAGFGRRLHLIASCGRRIGPDLVLATMEA